MQGTVEKLLKQKQGIYARRRKQVQMETDMVSDYSKRHYYHKPYHCDYKGKADR